MIKSCVKCGLLYTYQEEYAHIRFAGNFLEQGQRIQQRRKTINSKIPKNCEKCGGEFINLWSTWDNSGNRVYTKSSQGKKIPKEKLIIGKTSDYKQIGKRTIGNKNIEKIYVRIFKKK